MVGEGLGASEWLTTAFVGLEVTAASVGETDGDELGKSLATTCSDGWTLTGIRLGRSLGRTGVGSVVGILKDKSLYNMRAYSDSKAVISSTETSAGRASRKFINDRVRCRSKGADGDELGTKLGASASLAGISVGDALGTKLGANASLAGISVGEELGASASLGGVSVGVKLGPSDPVGAVGDELGASTLLGAVGVKLGASDPVGAVGNELGASTLLGAVGVRLGTSDPSGAVGK